MERMIVGEYGFEIYLDTGLDLTEESYDLTIQVLKPDGTEEEWEAGVDPDDDEQMVYTVQEGDLDQAGIYTMHAKVVGDTSTRIGAPVVVRVSEVFERSQ